MSFHFYSPEQKKSLSPHNGQVLLFIWTHKEWITPFLSQFISMLGRLVGYQEFSIIPDILPT